MSEIPFTHGGVNACSAGCVIFLVDESIAMETRIADGTKPKADVIATALNSLLKQLSATSGLEIAVVGYRCDAEGAADIGCRWDGSLAGRTFVRSEELAAAPITVETRTRKVPPPGGIGPPLEEQVPFPVWYVPRLGLMASRGAALEVCSRLLAERMATTHGSDKPPMVLSFVGDLAAVSGLAPMADVFRLAASGATPLLFHAHLSSSSRIPPLLYPSSSSHLPPGPVQEMFDASSVLPDPLTAAVREAQTAVNLGARGTIVNARLVDLIRLLSLVKAYAAWQLPSQAPVAADLPSPAGTEQAPAAIALPTAAPSVAPKGGPVLLALLLDRSIEDPAAAGEKTIWTRLRDSANDTLAQIARRGGGRIDAAVVCYGADAAGSEEIAVGLAGSLAGKMVVPGGELLDGALRVEEAVEKVSNGIGGVLEITRKRPIWIDLPAAAATEAASAVAAIGAIAADWDSQHAADGGRVIVLHLTRGLVDAAALGQLPGDVLVYHWIATETPHRSLSYPDHGGLIENAALARLWDSSGRLLAAESLAGKRPGLAADSRGFVVNGKFDLLLDGILD